MSEKKTLSDINEANRIFWKAHDPMTLYPESIAAATNALELYDTHGHGRFIWQAYQHFRAAEKHWPAYKKNLEDYTSQAHGIAAPLVDDGVISALRDRVLFLIDEVFDDLLKLRGTSDDTGSQAIKRTLKIDGRKAPVNSVARATDTEIVESMMTMYRHLASLQERYKGGRSQMPGPPPSSAKHIERIVAQQTGAGMSKIDAVWRAYLATGQHAGYCRELVDHCQRVDKELRAVRRPGPKTHKRSPARPSVDHVWRATIKKT
ncbi:hypothetical protein [Paraburkholderia caledonica]|jgi:hypothetical protein|uniref:hypothetical protein n=1 Tax=Paraburkholderia caledonica TaxID=134536 RepID=UPI00048027BB|nr:hypothetical protein [Paraburkholderia caledonica]